MITIGITTYNRLDLLTKIAASLYDSKLMYPYSIRIYDDASSGLSRENLLGLFPNAVSIHCHEKNQGSDANLWYMYNDFLNTNDDYLFNADSDLIFAHDWLNVLMEKIYETDGILSLFNTNRHGDLKQTGVFVEKESLGSAGTCFTRERVKEFVEALSQSNTKFSLDWKWSKFFRDRGVRLCATRQSYVQHVGFEGYNSSFGNVAYGQGFLVDTLYNGQVLNDVLEEVTAKKRESANKWYPLFPFEKVEKHAKIVIYGAGVVGKAYLQQIKQSNYCEVVAVVDKNYEALENVYAPESLEELSFDYLVVAVLQELQAENIKADIAALGMHLGDKMVFSEDNVIRL